MQGGQYCASVSHTKASLVGASISVPITNGRLNLGTWQGHCAYIYSFTGSSLNLTIPGIYLTEFRYMTHTRRVVATILFVLMLSLERHS